MYILGVDAGTTGTKTLLIDEKGAVAASSYKSYEIYKRPNLVVEQNAEHWWDAVVYTVRECVSKIKDRENIEAICVSSQGGSMVPVDINGYPLKNACVWMDKRGIVQRDDFLNKKGNDFFYKKTGWKLSAGSGIVQLKWIKDNEPDIFKSACRFLSTADYINHKLTGECLIDPTNAAMTNLMDIRTSGWDHELTELAGIDSNKLAGIVKAGTVIGEVNEKAKEQLGLITNTKVVMGGHDQYCTAVGVGANRKGSAFLSAGTAWVLLGITDTLYLDTKTYISPGRHIVDKLWGMLVSVPVGGIVMEWFKDNFSLSGESLKEIDRKASKLIQKNRDLFFYPYFNGSAYPKYDSHVKGSFMGIGLEHDRYDMALALMEAIAFEIKHALNGFENGGSRPRHIVMTGGGAKSDLWTNIMANTAGIPIQVMKQTEGACTGAAIIGGTGVGLFKGLDDGFEKMNVQSDTIFPVQDKMDLYIEKYETYVKRYSFIDKFYREG